MKKLMFGLVISLFTSAAFAALTVNIPFQFQPGSGQIVKKSPPLGKGDTVNCSFHTPKDLNVDLASNGNFFVTQPIGDATMAASFQGVKRSGQLSLSYQFKGPTGLKPDTDYVVVIVVDASTDSISCKLNPGPKPKKQ